MRGPRIISLEASTQTVDTIRVTVTGSLTWFLQLSNADVTPLPVLDRFTPPQSGWASVGAIGGAGAVSSTGQYVPGGGQFSLFDVNSQVFPHGEAVPLNTWAVVAVCIGSGSMHIQLDPVVKGIAFNAPACNGQPGVSIQHYSITPILRDLSVTTNGDISFQVHLFACTKARGCS